MISVLLWILCSLHFLIQQSSFSRTLHTASSAADLCVILFEFGSSQVMCGECSGQSLGSPVARSGGGGATSVRTPWLADQLGPVRNVPTEREHGRFQTWGKREKKINFPPSHAPAAAAVSRPAQRSEASAPEVEGWQTPSGAAQSPNLLRHTATGINLFISFSRSPPPDRRDRRGRKLATRQRGREWGKSGRIQGCKWWITFHQDTGNTERAALRLWPDASQQPISSFKKTSMKLHRKWDCHQPGPSNQSIQSLLLIATS